MLMDTGAELVFHDMVLLDVFWTNPHFIYHLCTGRGADLLTCGDIESNPGMVERGMAGRPVFGPSPPVPTSRRTGLRVSQDYEPSTCPTLELGVVEPLVLSWKDLHGNPDRFGKQWGDPRRLRRGEKDRLRRSRSPQPRYTNAL